MLSLLDQFNQLQESQTGPQAKEQSVVAGGNDNQAGDGRLSELTEKLDGFSQRIEQLENQEQPPPPPIDEEASWVSDEVLTRDEVSALVTEQLAEATAEDMSKDLTSRIEDLEHKLEKSLQSAGNSEEPPPPPPVPSFDATERIEDLELLNIKLSQCIDSLEERMSEVSDQLSVFASVSSVSSSDSDKKELDGVDNLVKVNPQSNYSDSTETSPQMTMNADEDKQESEESTEEETGQKDSVESDGNEELTIKKNTRIYNDARKYKIKLLKNRNES